MGKEEEEEEKMEDFLKFKKMITPALIRVLFWLGVAGAILAGFIGLVAGQYLAGILMILLGPIAVRIYCEVMILFFVINDTLTEIKNLIKVAMHGRPGPQA